MDEFLRSRMASRTRIASAGHRRVPGQPREGRGGPGVAELQRGLRLRRTDGTAVTMPLVLKLGGELLETGEQRARAAVTIASLASTRPLVGVDGGGRAIDAELARHDIAPRKIDGLRITDEPTRDVVVAVLAGSANTVLVAALVGAGVPAVGLTGVDAGLAPATRTS